VGSRIRYAQKGDVTRLSSIDISASSYPWKEHQFHACCDPDDASEVALVIESGTEAVGFVVFHHLLDEGSIHNIAVHPSQQRRGLARVLLTEALAEMREKGLGRCLLEVRESNDSAVSLYADMAFQLDGRRQNYYRSDDGREDALLMSRLL